MLRIFLGKIYLSLTSYSFSVCLDRNLQSSWYDLLLDFLSSVNKRKSKIRNLVLLIQR